MCQAACPLGASGVGIFTSPCRSQISPHEHGAKRCVSNSPFGSFLHSRSIGILSGSMFLSHGMSVCVCLTACVAVLKRGVRECVFICVCVCLCDSLSCLTGNIASWKKKEGEKVGAGEEMAEIETDKVEQCLAVAQECCSVEAPSMLRVCCLRPIDPWLKQMLASWQKLLLQLDTIRQLWMNFLKSPCLHGTLKCVSNRAS